MCFLRVWWKQVLDQLWWPHAGIISAFLWLFFSFAFYSTNESDLQLIESNNEDSWLTALDWVTFNQLFLLNEEHNNENIPSSYQVSDTRIQKFKMLNQHSMKNQSIDLFYLSLLTLLTISLFKVIEGAGSHYGLP